MLNKFLINITISIKYMGSDNMLMTIQKAFALKWLYFKENYALMDLNK